VGRLRAIRVWLDPGEAHLRARQRRPFARRAIAVLLISGLLLASCSALPDAAEDESSGAVDVRQPADLPLSDAFDGWREVDPVDEVSFRATQVDEAHDWSLHITSERAGGDAGPSLKQIASLPAEGVYEVSFVARAVDPDTHAPVDVIIGNPIDMMMPEGQRGSSSELSIGRLDAGWTSYSLTYSTPGPDTRFGVRIHVPREGEVVIDDLTVTGPAGIVPVLANGGFLDTSAPLAITNQSLLMDTEDAYVDLASRLGWDGDAEWALVDEAGMVSGEGVVRITDGLGEIDLRGTAPGLHSLTLDADLEGQSRTLVSNVGILADGPSRRDPSTMAFGVHLHYEDGTARTSALIESFTTLGIGHVRADVPWWWSEREDGTYVYDREIRDAMAHYADLGLSALHVPVYSNRLYDDGRTPSTPAGLAAYAEYTADILSEFDDAHSDVEVYNEFEHLGTSACGPTPDCYMDMLRATAPAIRGVSPDARIVAPGNAGMGFHLDWLERFFDLGGLEHIDAVSAHPYVNPEEPESLMADLETLSSMISARLPEGQTRDIWISEMGWATIPTWVTDRQQAAYTLRFAALAIARGVERIYWYEAADSGRSDTITESNFGLYEHASSALPNANAPKPVALALATYERLIGDRRFSHVEDLGPGVHSVVYGDGASTVRIAWSTAAPTPIRIVGEQVALVSMTGAPLGGETSVAGERPVVLTDEPVFLSGEASVALGD